MKQPAPLPALFRVALLAAITVGALVSFSAAQGVGLVAMASSSTGDTDVKLGAMAGLNPFGQQYAEAQEAAAKASRRATFSAIEAMGASRVVILLGLSASASMVFLGALFIRWSLKAPRAAIARLLGAAAFGAAVFRTLDGAQELVIARRAAEATLKVLVAANVPDAAGASGVALGLLSFVSVAWTTLVVGLFLLLGTYFRSDRVRGLLEALPDDEE
ncbi:MAG: hypothetical protein AB1730_03120 [Myxococcota bacterium]